jgi:DNA-binding XRE family transcriptional regulator
MNLQEWVSEKEGRRGELAEVLERTKQTVWNIEKGKYKPTNQMVIKIHKHTGLKAKQINQEVAAELKELFKLDLF